MQLPAKLDMIDFMTSKGVYIKVYTFCVVNKAIKLLKGTIVFVELLSCKFGGVHRSSGIQQ
ncbi:MAG: hypothetical protein CMIDDMOC_00054 [Sodalis sp. Fle]|nr:MAG: hypothetical protein CMIDDMOC_00054 [Sodalis sp. Fle]